MFISQLTIDFRPKKRATVRVGRGQRDQGVELSPLELPSGQAVHFPQPQPDGFVWTAFKSRSVQRADAGFGEFRLVRNRRTLRSWFRERVCGRCGTFSLFRGVGFFVERVYQVFYLWDGKKTARSN